MHVREDLIHCPLYMPSIASCVQWNPRRVISVVFGANHWSLTGKYCFTVIRRCGACLAIFEDIWAARSMQLEAAGSLEAVSYF